MNGSMKYENELLNIIKRLDLPKEFQEELASVFQDISKEFNLEEAHYEKILDELGTPDEFCHFYLENREVEYSVRNIEYKVQEIDNSIKYHINRARMSSNLGSKFAPQYSKMTIFILILVALVSFTASMGIFIDENSIFWLHHDYVSYFMFYVLYEIFSGVSGWHFTSRRIAYHLRLFFRGVSYTGFFISYIYFHFIEFGDNLLNFQREWYFMILWLEIVIFIKEVIPGFVPLNYHIYKTKRKVWMLYFLIFFSYTIIDNIDTIGPVLFTFGFSILLLLLVLSKIVKLNTEHYFLLGITPVSSVFRFEDSGWLKYNILYRNNDYTFLINILFVVGAAYLIVLVILWYSNRPDLPKDDELLTSETKFSKFIETQELRLSNFFIKYKIKLYYIFIPFLIMYIIDYFIRLYEDEKVIGGFGNYFRIPYEYALLSIIITLICVIIFFAIIETNQKVVKENQVINVKTFFNIKKFTLLSIIVIMVSTSVSFVGLETHVYHENNAPDIEQRLGSIYGDLEIRTCPICGTLEQRENGQYFEFFDQSNANYSQFDIPNVDSFLPYIEIRASIEMSDWDAFLTFIIVNESLYENFVANSGKSPSFEFGDKIYMLDQDLYDKFAKEETLTYDDGYHERSLDIDIFEAVEISPGFSNGDSSTLFTTLKTWNNIFDVKISDFYKTEFYEGNEEYTEINVRLNMINDDISEYTVDSLYNTFEDIFNGSRDNFHIGKVYFYEDDSERLNDYVIKQYIFELIWGIVIALAVSVLLINSNLIGDREKLLKVNIYLVLSATIFNAAGLLQGLYEYSGTRGIFIEHTNNLQPDYDMTNIFISIGIKIGLQILGQLYFSWKRYKTLE